MNKKTKNLAKGLVVALCLMLVFALGFGITGAWYKAERTATGTVILDNGIELLFSNVRVNGDDLATEAWDKGFADAGTLLYDEDGTATPLASVSIVPNKEITILNPSVARNDDEKAVEVFARVKLTANVKVYGADRAIGDTAINLADYTTGDDDHGVTLADIFANELNFADVWKASDNGYYVYSTAAGAASNLPTTQVSVFADGDLKVADWTSEFGGPIIKNADGTEFEVATVEFVLDFEFIQSTVTGDALDNFVGVIA